MTEQGAVLRDECSGCGQPRPKRARWNWIWSQVGKLEPVAVYCPPCAAERDIKPRKTGRGPARRK